MAETTFDRIRVAVENRRHAAGFYAKTTFEKTLRSLEALAPICAPYQLTGPEERYATELICDIGNRTDCSALSLAPFVTFMRTGRCESIA
jgi:hypothetical protein